MLNKELLPYLCCPVCRSDLVLRSEVLVCASCGERCEVGSPHLIKVVPTLTPDLELSIRKWDEIYAQQLRDGSHRKGRDSYLADFFEDTYRQLDGYQRIGSETVYLEIGCGPMILGQQLAKHCRLVIGVDTSAAALEIAQKCLEEEGVTNYLLILGDLRRMPLKNDQVDLIYGGGVIEHFKDTQACVNELYRVLKPGGVSFNTVPYLNLGSLYRQLRGNIPNLAILRQLAEFVHLKLLRGRHTTFGYELAFLGTTLASVHRRAGFSEVVVEKFDVDLVFDPIPARLRPFLSWLANSSRLFWPMVKVVGRK